MDATSTSATDSYNWGTSTGWGTITSSDIDTGTSANFGISPTIAHKKPLKVPNYDNVPRIHKDKNGCIKKSYWSTQPFNIKDLGGLGFNVAGGDAYTISTSGVANMTMGDTDDAQGSVRISSASA